MPIADDRLYQLLAQANVASEKDLKQAYQHAQERAISLEEAVIELKLIKETELGTLIASRFKLPYVDLAKIEISEETLKVIPKDTAIAQKTIVFAVDDKEVKVASNTPENNLLPKMLAKKTGKKVVLYFSTLEAIKKVIANYHTDYQKLFNKLLSQDSEQAVITESSDPPVTKMVEMIIHTAMVEGVSDIHIEPQEKEVIIRLRIDGVLHETIIYPKSLHERIVTRIKVLAKLRTDEHLSAQDGKIRMVFDEGKLDLRISIIPIADGEKVVLRLLVSKAGSYTLLDLGMADDDVLKVTKATNKSFGMVVCTGPTGSGKTTSIYSILKNINTTERNLTSIEDPIEYRIKGANQTQVNVKTNLTFANGLRALLRQDPDYIFVGEVRDNETAAIAVNAALTGHLVFSTLHTNSAAGALPRLIDMNVEPFLVASTVNLIIAQRLVRKICEKCRVSETISLEELSKHFSKETIKKHATPLGSKQEVRVYKGKGCKHCHDTGYSGRVAIYEVLEVTKELRALIIAKADSDKIQDQAVAEGMNLMIDDGFIKVTKGLTTIEEILRVTKTEM